MKEISYNVPDAWEPRYGGGKQAAGDFIGDRPYWHKGPLIGWYCPPDADGSGKFVSVDKCPPEYISVITKYYCVDCRTYFEWDCIPNFNLCKPCYEKRKATGDESIMPRTSDIHKERRRIAKVLLDCHLEHVSMSRIAEICMLNIMEVREVARG